MRPWWICALGAAGCGDDLLHVESIERSGFYSTQNVTYRVFDAAGNEVAGGDVPGPKFDVAVTAGSHISFGENTSSSPTASGSVHTTYTEVGPGDTVRHRVPPPMAPGMDPGIPVARMELFFTPLPNEPIGTRYRFVTPCETTEGGSGRATLYFYSNCAPAGPFDLAGMTVQGDYYLVVPGIVVDHEAFIEAQGVPWQAAPAMSVTIRGIDPAVDRLSLRRASAAVASRAASVDPGGDTVTLQIATIPVEPGHATLTVVTARPDALGVQSHSFGVEAGRLAAELDLAPHRFPWITGRLQAAPEGGVSWTQSGDGAIDVAAAYYGTYTIGPPSSSFSETAYGPGTGARITAGQAVGGGAPNESASIHLFADSRIDGYRDFIAGAGAPLIMAPGDVRMEAHAPADVDD